MHEFGNRCTSKGHHLRWFVCIGIFRTTLAWGNQIAAGGPLLLNSFSIYRRSFTHFSVLFLFWYVLFWLSPAFESDPQSWRKPYLHEFCPPEFCLKSKIGTVVPHLSRAKFCLVKHLKPAHSCCINPKLIFIKLACWCYKKTQTNIPVTNLSKS